jgi:hypothetical protein
VRATHRSGLLQFSDFPLQDGHMLAQRRLRSRFRSDNGKPRRSTPSWCKRSNARNNQMGFVRMARAHLPHQPIKMCATPGIDQDQFPVEDRRLCL